MELYFNFSEKRPLFNELDYGNNLLKKLVESKIDIDEMPNILIYGPNYSGKTTMINAFFASIFGRNFYDTKNLTLEIDRKIFNYKTSSYHLEFCAKELGTNDKIFIHEFIKTFIETRNIGLNIPKIVIIRNASLLSPIAQMALRRIIEKNSYTSRFIFENNSLSSFQEPLISRCLLIKIKPPSFEEIKNSIIKISDDIKSKNSFDLTVIDDIIKNSTEFNGTNNYNLKKIYGEAFHYIHTGTKYKYIYDDVINNLYDLVESKKILMTNLDKIRDIINELYINLYPMKDLIFKTYYFFVNKYSYDDNFMKSLMELTIKTDINMCKGNKECIHTEFYFIALFELLLSVNIKI